MALRLVSLFLVATVTIVVRPVGAQGHLPIPRGYSMATLGTLAFPGGLSGRQPWASSAVLRDTLAWGVALSGADIYDDMDNFGGSDIRRASVGTWVRTRAVTAKVAYSHLNALGVYFEQEGYLSLGTDALGWLSVSAELRGRRVGLYGLPEERESVVEAGLTLFLPRRYAAVQLAVDHITLNDAAVPGVRVPTSILVGVHSTRQAFGALGVTAKVVTGAAPYVRIAVGNEYWFCRVFGVSVAIATRPFMVGIGAVFDWRGYGTAVSLVHHPVLGWTQGFTVDYARKRRSR